jgi:hypothetical protein
MVSMKRSPTRLMFGGAGKGMALCDLRIIFFVRVLLERGWDVMG